MQGVLPMMFALRSEDAHLRDQPFDTWARKRVEAGPHLIGDFVDPLCGQRVEARFVGGIWQWIHVRRRCSHA